MPIFTEASRFWNFWSTLLSHHSSGFSRQQHHHLTMPDAFFQSDKKRKRPNRNGASSSTPNKPYEKPYRPAAYGKGQKPSRAPGRSNRDEEIESDAEGDQGGDLDSMDFRKNREEVALSDEEFQDENETAAEKRVRLAKGYLAKVRSEVEAGTLLECTAQVLLLIRCSKSR
jgi:hypothetical protein